MKNNYQYISSETENRVTTLTFNRPEVHNAFHFEMLNEILDFIQEIKVSQSEILVLKGKGKSFCTGADINWFFSLNSLNDKELKSRLQSLQQVLYKLYQLPIIKIAQLKGSVMGGGIGLAAACDYVIADQETKMAFREVRLGITPALISPFVVNKIGAQKAKEWMLNGSLIDIGEAQKFALVSQVVKSEELEKSTNKLLEDLLKGSPFAKKNIGKLISDIDPLKVKKNMLDIALENLISVIKSNEAKEGFQAFLKKRKTAWL